MNCKRCFVLLSQQRASVSPYCLTCGNLLANQEIDQKKNMVMPLFNKGGYQFAGGKFAKQNLVNCKNPMVAGHMSSGSSGPAKMTTLKLPPIVGVAFLPNGDKRLYRAGETIPNIGTFVRFSTAPG